MRVTGRAQAWMQYLGYNVSDKGVCTELEDRNMLYREYSSIAKEEISEEISVLIRKDMHRTKLGNTCIQSRNNSANTQSEYMDIVEQNGSTRRECITKILMTLAVTNKTIGYVQGMNLLCSIVYYVVQQGVHSAYVDSVCYICFFYLMVDVGDLFSEKMDTSSSGVHGQVQVVQRVLRKSDRVLYKAVVDAALFETSPFYLLDVSVVCIRVQSTRYTYGMGQAVRRDAKAQASTVSGSSDNDEDESKHHKPANALCANSTAESKSRCTEDATQSSKADEKGCVAYSICIYMYSVQYMYSTECT